jgi:flagellar biogenesis protein FliO
MSPLASYVVETLITLVAIVALAVLVLYGARRVGLGRPAGPLRLVGRLPLDGRRAVYLVRVGGTVYVLGCSEAGLEKVGEHAADDLDLPPELEPDPKLGHALARLLGKNQDGTER